MIPHTTPFSLKNTWCLLLCYLWVTTILVFLPFTHNINIYTHSSQWVPPNAPSSAHLYRYSTATSPTPFLAPYSQPPNFTCFVSFSILSNAFFRSLRQHQSILAMHPQTHQIHLKHLPLTNKNLSPHFFLATNAFMMNTISSTHQNHAFPTLQQLLSTLHTQHEVDSTLIPSHHQHKHPNLSPPILPTTIHKPQIVSSHYQILPTHLWLPPSLKKLFLHLYPHCAWKSKHPQHWRIPPHHSSLMATMHIKHIEPTKRMATQGDFILGPIWSSAHLESSPLGLEVGLSFSPTLQSGPEIGPCNIKSIGPLVGPKLEIPL